ncbi:MAG: pitrilysin family protein [Thermodesulfobacteriota bacterium]
MPSLGDPSTVRKSVLPNGIRVLSETVPQFTSATLGIWVENGSVYEPAELNGISHFLEHIFFKGTERRTAKEIAESIDGVGGVLNAFTSKEYTCYYAKVLREDLPLALDVLSDLFLNSTFAEEEIERERGVILSEISESEDTPDDHVHVVFDRGFWPGHPLSLPITGTAQTVSGMRREHFLRFLAERYRPDRVLVCAAGAVDHDWLVEQVSATFGGLEGASGKPDLPLPEARPSLSLVERELEQVQMVLGVPGLQHTDPRRYAAYVMNTALGGGMSSRLFQEVREKRGKAYTISSYLASFHHTGYLAVNAGLGADSVTEVIDVVREEMRKLAQDGLEPAELARAKSQIKGTILLSLESSESRMSRIAKNEMYFGRNVEPSEVAEAISRVTQEDVSVLARELFSARLGLALLGDLAGIKINEAVLAPA